MKYIISEWKIKKIIGRRWYRIIQNKAIEILCGTTVHKQLFLCYSTAKQLEEALHKDPPCIGHIYDVWGKAKGIQKLYEIIDNKSYICINCKGLLTTSNINNSLYAIKSEREKRQGWKNIEYYIKLPTKFEKEVQ